MKRNIIIKMFLGIPYIVDNNTNDIYDYNDILNHKENPKTVGKWTKDFPTLN